MIRCSLVTLLLCCATAQLHAQFDCNGNGVSDAVEIASGELQDCNGNGVPDACDVRTSPAFAIATNVPAGTLPMSLINVDIDGDGRADLVAVDRTAGQVLLMLNGGGSLFTPTTLGVGSAPEAVVAADFDGDGRIDLATANFASNNVSVLLQQESDPGTPPAFAAAKNYNVGSGPTALAALDLNADGKPDLAVANRFSNNVSQLINDGTGQFTAGTPQAVGVEPIAMAIADFDADGKPDIAVANLGSDNISVLLSSGEDVPPTPATFGAPFAAATGDFNGDGAPDLAIANYSLGTVSILLNTGNGFSAGGELTGLEFPAALVARDMNGDGLTDLIVADAFTVNIFTAQGSGAFFITRHAALGGLTNSLTVGNLSGAGGNEIALANEQGSVISILRNETAPAIADDCNNNQVPDSCDFDANGNGIPDDCEAPQGGGGGGGGGSVPPPEEPGGQEVPAGCGAGACGAGSVPMVPAIFLGLGAMKFVSTRRRRQ